MAAALLASGARSGGHRVFAQQRYLQPAAAGAGGLVNHDVHAGRAPGAAGAEKSDNSGARLGGAHARYYTAV